MSFNNLYFFFCKPIQFTDHLVDLLFVFADFGLVGRILQIVFAFSDGEDLVNKLYEKFLFIFSDSRYWYLTNIIIQTSQRTLQMIPAPLWKNVKMIKTFVL